MDKKYKAFLKTWYGISKFESDIFAVTPVSKIFDILRKERRIIRSNKGWHHRSLLEAGNSNIELLHFSQGEQFKDLLSILKNIKIRKLFFVGYCGYLGNNDKIGKIISPSIINYRYDKSINFDNEAEEVIMTVPQMIMGDAYYINLQTKNIYYVDMESYYVAHWSQVYSTNVDMKLIVSDQPLSKPFYDLNDNDWKMVNAGIATVMGRITDTLQ